MAPSDDPNVFRTLAELYAQAADRNRPELLDRIMAEDAVIEGPGFRLNGRVEIRTIPASLHQRFHATRHVVENQAVTVDGAAAAGETYCTANHLYEQPGTGMQVLAEGNTWHDSYWGTCQNPGPHPPQCAGTGRGANHLGQILMAVRMVLRPD